MGIDPNFDDDDHHHCDDDHTKGGELVLVLILPLCSCFVTTTDCIAITSCTPCLRPRNTFVAGLFFSFSSLLDLRGATAAAEDAAVVCV